MSGLPGGGGGGPVQKSAVGAGMEITAEDKAEADEWYAEFWWDWAKVHDANRRRPVAGQDICRCPACRGMPYVKPELLGRAMAKSYLCPWCRGAGLVPPQMEAHLRARAAQEMLTADDDPVRFMGVDHAAGPGGGTTAVIGRVEKGPVGRVFVIERVEDWPERDPE